ncbi:ABC transporter ATP-binding protein [Pseudogemmobacter humi]|uniref:Spermidine/putrescine import ATP-binding protein PotA n=1 Tax=Pseudogemmobacter humi TaxID=2483812 RepID=A0A3P5WYK7_9RHOB|nr:ABC transporter ATP-binding protein [Pseudogemmobacter humi]VDC23406.1 Spermidine/putrescine import ATP-binding protein PotA [Pseudogemmobacter humi]
MLVQPFVRIDNVTKRFGRFTALDRISLDIAEGEFLTIVGPSGSGKSTLIRLLVGIDDVTEGTISLNGSRIDTVPANKRPTCMVFQSLALFPHMSVGKNIEFPLKLKKVTPADRRARALELLRLLRLPEDYYGKMIGQLSGGERQRVALARALAFDPEIIVFDEPLSALDYRLRKTLEKELKDLHGRTGKTFVYITHSLEEAMVMSDRIAIMRRGRFEQIASAEEIYSRPVSRFVASFMGEVNLFDLAVDGAGQPVWQGAGVTAAPGALTLAPGWQGALMVRPELVRFLAPGQSADFTVQGQMAAEYALGSRIQYSVQTEGGMVITVERPFEARHHGAPGAPVALGWDRDAVHPIAGTGEGGGDGKA